MAQSQYWKLGNKNTKYQTGHVKEEGQIVYSEDQLIKKVHRYSYFQVAIIPSTVKLVKKGTKYISNETILGEKKPICELKFFHKIIEKNGLAICHIDDAKEYDRIKAVKNNAMALKYFKQFDESLALLAVSRNGLALKHVPDELKTQSVCMVAVLNNPMALQYVGKPTFNICIAAISKNPFVIEMLRKIKKLQY